MRGLIIVRPVSRWEWIWSASTEITSTASQRIVAWSKVAGGTTMTRGAGIRAATRAFKMESKRLKRIAEDTVCKEIEY